MSFTEILDALFTSVRLCIETLLQNDTIKTTVFNGQADLFQVLIGFLLIALLISAVLRPIRMSGGLVGGVGRFVGSIERANRRIESTSSASASSSPMAEANVRMAEKRATVMNAR